MPVWELLPEIGELRIIIVPRSEVPSVKIVELLENPKVEDSAKDHPPSYSSFKVVSIVHKPPIAKHPIIDNFEAKDPTIDASPTYCLSKEVSPTNSLLLSIRDKGLEGFPSKTFFSTWKKKL